MGYSWKILRAAVEQEILFPSKKSFEDYLDKLNRRNDVYDLLNEKLNQDGTYIVIMRKAYNNNVFLRKDQLFDEVITPEIYLKAILGEAFENVKSLSEMRDIMDENGLDHVWDYPTEDLDEAIANNDYLVQVSFSEPEGDYIRIFEVPEEICERLKELLNSNSKELFNLDEQLAAAKKEIKQNSSQRDITAHER